MCINVNTLYLVMCVLHSPSLPNRKHLAGDCSYRLYLTCTFMSLTIFIDCVGGKGVVGFVVAKLQSYFLGGGMYGHYAFKWTYFVEFTSFVVS